MKNIPIDKQAHFLVGAAIASTVTLYATPVLGLVLCFVAAVYEDVVIPAVLDEDGNEVEAERIEQQLVTEAVEAKEAYTRTDTYETLEEAPEGATERTRLGVRYPELLAFIIGAM